MLIARLETGIGTILLRLFEHEAPEAVQHFVALATKRVSNTLSEEATGAGSPAMDGALFHRVFPDFMIQCAAKLSESDIEAFAHLGETSRLSATSAALFLPFDRPGRVAFASEVGRGLGTCFFITEVPTPHLDGRHVIFGEVVRGFELVPKIARVHASANGLAYKPVAIEHISIDRATST